MFQLVYLISTNYIHYESINFTQFNFTPSFRNHLPPSFTQVMQITSMVITCSQGINEKPPRIDSLIFFGWETTTMNPTTYAPWLQLKTP